MCGIWYAWCSHLYVSVCSVCSVARGLHVCLCNYGHMLVLLCVSVCMCCVAGCVPAFACVCHGGNGENKAIKIPFYTLCELGKIDLSGGAEQLHRHRVWQAEWSLDFSPH